MSWQNLTQEILEEFAAWAPDLDILQAVALAQYLERKRGNSKDYRDRQRCATANTEERECRLCGRRFPVVCGYRRGRLREYCGPRCRKAAENRRAWAKHKGVLS